ncbi:hypothetical protein DH2020_014882 [Rehmannia glutinosa]|uniref:DUF1985 domain-containing protein n=1 Tax=Rehmannia glutinosa TaxID=99300 RepID=A0ABR0X0V7_REHGL
MAYFTTIENRFDSRVTSRCNLQVLRLVYDKLDAVHKEMLLNSAFGELYKFRDNMQISCKLLHALLFMRIKSPVDDEVWFRVGDANARFGFPYFTLITGLNPEIENDFVKDIPSDRRLAAEYFGGGKKVVRPSVLKTTFKHQAKNEEDRYKLGLTLIYECVLRCKEPTTSIDMKILQVVDNLDLVNKYPWGRSSYEYLLRFVSIVSDHEEMEKEYVVMFPACSQDLDYPLDEERCPR